MAIMSVVHLRLTGDVERALVLLHERLAATRERKGCLRAETVQDREDSGHIVLLETWESPEDEAAYRTWRAEEPPNPEWRAFVAAAPEVWNFTLRDDV